MSLVFEPAAPAAPPDVHRADVACFVGFVGRRAGRPLPDALRAQLDAAGWVHGLWRKPAEQIEALLNVPVVLDSWHLFDRYFAWDARPLKADGSAHCATYLGAAVRSFFARGGRRAVVVRVGDPWAYLEDDATRAAQRNDRLRLLLPALASGSVPFAPHDPAQWQGAQHLAGLRDVSLLLLPDLIDTCGTVPPPLELPTPLAVTPEGFAPCDDETPPEPDTALQHVPAPRLDDAGFARWRDAAHAARDFLAWHQRDTLLLAAVPLPLPPTRHTTSGDSVYAQADPLAYLQRVGVLQAQPDNDARGRPADALMQLAWPWLRTRASRDLPQGLEPADGVLAGLVATGAMRRGTFRSVAGDASLPLLRDVADAEPMPAWSGDDDSPAGQLARRVCLIAPGPDGWALQSDVTASADEAWRFGGASRLIATVLRAARAAGETVVFDTNGPALWARLRRTIEDLLLGFWREGAFGGDSASQAFDVRCDRRTMTQADLDAGRLIVEIAVLPAASIERITVTLDLGSAASSNGLQEAA